MNIRGFYSYCPNDNCESYEYYDEEDAKNLLIKQILSQLSSNKDYPLKCCNHCLHEYQYELNVDVEIIERK